jgi:PAS domain S-box-containing protein
MAVIRSLSRKTILARLEYILVPLVFVAFALMVLVSSLFGMGRERAHLEEDAEALFATIETKLKSDLKELETMTAMISESVRTRLLSGADIDEMKTYMTQLSDYSQSMDIPGFLSIFAYFNIPGQIERTGFSSASPDTDWEALEASGLFVFEERDWYILANENSNQIVMTHPYVEVVTGEVALAYARSLYDDEGNRISIVGLNVFLDRIYSFSSVSQGHSNQTWMLLDNNLNIIAFPFPEYLGVPLSQAHGAGISGIAYDLEQYGYVNGHRFKSHDGSEKMHSVRQLDNGWYLGVATPIDEFHANLWTMWWYLGGMGIIMAGVLSIVLVRVLASRNKAVSENNMLANMDNILNSIDAMIYVTIPETGEILFMNDNLKKHFNFEGDPVGQLCYKVLQDGFDEKCDFCPYLQLEKNPDKIIKSEEHNTLTKRVYQNTDRLIDWPDGRKVHIQHSVDMTEMIQAREQTKFQYEKLDMIVKATKIGLWDMPITLDDPLNPDNFIIWSDEFRHMMGFEDENDFPNVLKMWGERLHPEDAEAIGKAVLDHLMDKTGQTPYFAEFRIMKKDGNYMHIRASGATIRDKEGNPLRAMGALIDLTEIKNLVSAAEIANEEKEFQLGILNLVIKSTKIGLWGMEVTTDDPGSFENKFVWSPEFRQILGYEDENDFPNVADSLLNSFHPDDKETVLAAFAACILDTTGKTTYDVKYRAKKKDGEYGYYRATGDATRDENGNVLRVWGAFIDMTPMKNLVDEAEARRIEAETANKAKSQFLSHVSHEIRTPMNAVLGTAEIQLQKDSNTPEAEEAFNLIYNSGNLLLNIINDILDLSKIEAGKLELVLARYDIPSLVYDTVQLILLRYESKPIAFDLDIDEKTPLDLLGDELRIKQVLNNTLSNAFKYTEKGRVKLSVKAEVNEEQLAQAGPESHTDCTLIITISDTGQGMSKEQVERLFEEYTRFNLSTNRTIVGTGLGMHITKRLLNTMNGEVSVESEVGVGSVFTIRIPQKKIGTEVCGAEITEKLRASRFKKMLKLNRAQIMHEYMPYGSILIVDDVESNLYVAKGIMLPYGLHIETAVSGFEAIDKVKNGNVYDIIFMDHMMPKMNGVETTKILRDMGYNHPIVALTANVVVGVSDMFLSSGFDGFVSKPIDIRELNAQLNRLIRDKQPPEVIEAARRERELQNKASVPELAQKMRVNEEIAAAVTKDIKNALTVLEVILKRLSANPYEANQEDLQLFVTTVHGMKSALANIGEKELSAAALELERSGTNGDLAFITLDTPIFIKALEALVERIKPKEAEAIESAEVSEDDLIFLKANLHEIIKACKTFNKKVIKATLDDLKQKPWPAETIAILNEISEYLLRGEFKKVVSAAEKITEPT